MSRSQVHQSSLAQIAEALETAGGCLDLVRRDVKPVDLEDCIKEIDAARDVLAVLMEDV